MLGAEVVINTDEFLAPVGRLNWGSVEEWRNSIRPHRVGLRNHRQERLHIGIIRIEGNLVTRKWHTGVTRQMGTV